jgi:hypothetical protein
LAEQPGDLACFPSRNHLLACECCVAVAHEIHVSNPYCRARTATYTTSRKPRLTRC